MMIQSTLLFLLSIAAMWFFGGILVDTIGKIAKRFNKSGFIVAFVILGFLTSISEFSVMINASVGGVPQVSAGNLSGASVVILLLIIPVLAVAGGGISFTGLLNRRQLGIALAAIAAPALFLLDGIVSSGEGVIALVVYGTALYFLRKEANRKPPELLHEDIIDSGKATFFDFVKVVVSAGVLFLAGYLLVKEVVDIAQVFDVPASIVSLLVLSIGTNIPEIIVAIRSVSKGRSDIALGNYLGSASANTLIFGLLSVGNGTFLVDVLAFQGSGLIMIIGIVLFYMYARSRNVLSKKEGSVLLLLYVCFLAIQTFVLLARAM